MPNPTLAKLYEGVEIAIKRSADLILAVGGGSKGCCGFGKTAPTTLKSAFGGKNRIEKAKKMCYNDKNTRQFHKINRYV